MKIDVLAISVETDRAGKSMWRCSPGYLEMKIKWKQNMQFENNLTGEIMKINYFENENQILNLFSEMTIFFR